MRRDLSIGALLALTGLGLSAILALALANRMKRAIEALADAASRSVAPDLARSLRTREIVEVEKALVDAAQARESRLVAETRKEEAESANRKKDQFIAVLSHELRNPLSTLGNSVHILRHRFGDDAELRPVIEMMERQTGQLARLVNDLLDVSRINLGKVEIRAQRIDLRAVLQQALESVDPALKRKRHQLERHFPDQPVHLEGDFARLAQVFSNLLDNAAKFTPPGGRISVSLETRDGHALVRVADNGTGVDPEFLPHMFERFAQADNTLERGEAGLGVGLALALDLVRAHGGQILAESQGPGRGSVFTVRLPLS
jgi:signal transduction histidine kinase